jgi:hypothetical protein
MPVVLLSMIRTVAFVALETFLRSVEREIALM